MSKGINELRGILKQIYNKKEYVCLKQINDDNEFLDKIEDEVREWAIRQLKNKWTVIP